MVLSSLFSIKCFTYYIIYILILYFVLLIIKHMFKSICSNSARLSVLKFTCILYIMLFLKNKIISITIVFAKCTETRFNGLTNCSYQKPWLRTHDFFKEKKIVNKFYMILRICFPTESNNLKLSLPKNKYLLW